jgi:hypothetical protein
MNYVGIDIHKRYSVLAAQDETGRKLKEARIEGQKGGSVCEEGKRGQSLRLTARGEEGSVLKIDSILSAR